LDSVDAQWVTAKKDWQEAKKRYKESEKLKDDKPNDVHASNHPADESGSYSEEMDEMRCILYSHGGSSINSDMIAFHHHDQLLSGGYYFGSVDQER